jgi:serine/threonine protein kinase
VDLKKPHINNMTFTNIVWQNSRAVRMRRLSISNMEFIGCTFNQTSADEVMVKAELVTLYGTLRFKDCNFISFTDTLTSSTSWASFNFLRNKTRKIADVEEAFVLDQVSFSATRGAAGEFQLMEIDVDGARNLQIYNSRFTGGATLYLSDSIGVVIHNTTFTDTGISSTTSSNITIRNCLFKGIRVLDRSRSPYARSIHFKDASPPGTGPRTVTLIGNEFRDFVPEAGISNAAVSFSASPARIYFDAVTLTGNRFINLDQKGLYSVMDEDFALQIQAQRNWWGSTSGPRDGCNRKARGSNIWWDTTTLRTNVLYRPWCANEACTSTASNSSNCPWPVYIYIVIALSSVLGLVCVIVVVLAARQYVLGRQYSRLQTEKDDQFHSRLLKRVKNLDELCAKYNVRRIHFSQLELGERIGEGTFGYVHKAVYVPDVEVLGFIEVGPHSPDFPAPVKRVVAVKYIKNRWLAAYDSIGNFLDEIKIMSMVEHPHVQSLIGLAVDDEENICMVSEFMSRGSLTSVIDSPDLNVARKLDISLDTAYGMYHLHSKGMRVVHRDLKPGNILISQDWVARVADFGTSIAIRQTSSVASAVGTTPVYLSPEAALNNEFSEQSDVFAYGITLYELWAQEISYPALTDGGLSVIQNYARKRLPPDLPRLPKLPPKISSLISHCVAHEPEDRPTFDQILSYLVSSRGEIRIWTADSKSSSVRSTVTAASPAILIENDVELEMDSFASSSINLGSIN